MTPEVFADKIGLPAAAKEAVIAFDIPAAENKRLRELFLSDFTVFEAELNKKDDPNMWALALIFRWSAESMALWRETGIPDEIAFDTFRDITLWSGRYFERTGRIGLIEWRWFTIHITVKLFRLGRLQFEPIGMRENVTLPDGTFIAKGTPVLSVHIPRGDGFTPESIRESFEASKEFFPKYFGTSYDTYVCTSWLLAPQLEGMISETSTIANFRNYFTIYSEDLSYAQAEDYVFLQKLDDKTKYPENTSLQRNLKKFLMGGGTMGMGKAVARF